MLKSRLNRLERMIDALGGVRCALCGATRGHGGVPRVLVMGESDGGVYNDDGGCRRCGAEAPGTLNIVTPLTLAGRR